MRNGGVLMFRFSHSSTLPLIHNELIFSIKMKMFVFQERKNLFLSVYMHGIQNYRFNSNHMKSSHIQVGKHNSFIVVESVCKVLTIDLK